MEEKVLIEFKGGNGKLELYSKFVRIDRGTAAGFIFHGLKGKKDIYFDKITSTQIKKQGFTTGYIQFSIGGGNESQKGAWVAIKDENSVTFAKQDQYEKALKIKKYIENHRISGEDRNFSVAEELKKLHDLVKQGIITKDDFEKQKKKLLEK